jgi:hypothetical protein
MPGDLLTLDENVIPTWGPAKKLPYMNPAKTSVADLIKALIASGLMEEA